jgi:hypothetical protein
MEVEEGTKENKQDQVEEEKIQFMCNECKMSELVHYHGKSPPFVKNVEFLEDAYIMKDPFSAPPSRHGTRSFTEYFINIGANCAICRESFCKDCSIFYSSTFCYRCAYENVSQFPLEIQSKIRKEYLAIKDR